MYIWVRETPTNVGATPGPVLIWISIYTCVDMQLRLTLYLGYIFLDCIDIPGMSYEMIIHYLWHDQLIYLR